METRKPHGAGYGFVKTSEAKILNDRLLVEIEFIIAPCEQDSSGPRAKSHIAAGDFTLLRSILHNILTMAGPEDLDYPRNFVIQYLGVLVTNLLDFRELIEGLRSKRCKNDHTHGRYPESS